MAESSLETLAPSPRLYLSSTLRPPPYARFRTIVSQVFPMIAQLDSREGNRADFRNEMLTQRFLIRFLNSTLRRYLFGCDSIEVVSSAIIQRDGKLYYLLLFADVITLLKLCV